MANAVQRYGVEMGYMQAAAALGLVRRAQEALSNGDGVVGRYFSERAVWIDVSGTRIVGSQQIAEFGRGAATTMGAVAVHYEVVSIQVVRADVLVVSMLHSPTDAGGKLVSGPMATATYVIGREAGAWKIAAGHSTFIANPF